MLTVRQAHERGKTQTPWLDSHHTFSFNQYYDPRYTGFRDLLVINEDYVASGMGFGTHGHQDMEIISYVVEGQLAHKDSTGGEDVLRPADRHRPERESGRDDLTHSPHSFRRQPGAGSSARSGPLRESLGSSRSSTARLFPTPSLRYPQQS